MPIQRPLALVNGRVTVLPASDTIAGAGDIYFGSTRYEMSQIRQYAASGVTDANGRITVYLTTNGLQTGTALFSSIKSIQTSGLFAGTTIPPNFNIQSVSADLKTLVIQASVLSVSVLGILTVSNGQSGLTGYVTVIGLP